MMRHLILLVCLGLAFLSPALAVDLEKLAAQPATIEVEGMDPVKLRVSGGKQGWIEVPKRFKSRGATVYAPEGGNPGVAEFRVIQDGYVLLACNFDYQGNESGGWKDDALTRDEFRRMGWREIRKPKKIGGALIKGDRRVQTLFYKRVYRGENFKLRCNKYDPPYPILLGRAVKS